MSGLVNQWIDLFRAGNYGDKGVFTDQDVKQIADSYDPSFHEAPVVIGHPKTDAPAYGWVDQLRAVGGLLQGKLRQVQPQFEELVKGAAFKKRSVRLYKTATGHSLRHVGFLGAQPPDIKGLADIKFDDEDQKAIEIDFSEETQMADTQQLEDSLFTRLKALITPKPAEGPAFSEEQSTALKAAVKEALTPIESELATAKAALTKAQTDFAERETKISTAETKSRAATAIAKVKAKGAWVPAFDKADLPLIFEELAASSTTVEFSEGDTKVQKPLLDRFTDFMESLGAIVPAGRLVGGQPGTAAIPAGLPANADPTSVQFSEVVKTRMAEKNETFEVAMDAVAKAQPQLTRPGGATAGRV